MSLRAISWALYDAPLENQTEKIILLVMADVADDEGQGSHLAVETIARRALVGESTVRRHRAALQQRGLLIPSDDLPASLLAIPADRRPACFDLSMGRALTEDYTGARFERPLAAGPKPTTNYIPNLAAVPTLDGGSSENLDEPLQPMEDAPTTPVTARNQGVPWTTVHLLKTWFGVTTQERVDAWRAAWSRGVDVSDLQFADIHLVAYLTRCRQEKRAPRADLWLRFLHEDWARHLAEQRAQQDRLEQAGGDGGEAWALGTLKRTPRWEVGNDDSSGTRPGNSSGVGEAGNSVDGEVPRS